MTSATPWERPTSSFPPSNISYTASVLFLQEGVTRPKNIVSADLTFLFSPPPPENEGCRHPGCCPLRGVGSCRPRPPSPHLQERRPHCQQVSYFSLVFVCLGKERGKRKETLVTAAFVPPLSFFSFLCLSFCMLSSFFFFLLCLARCLKKEGGIDTRKSITRCKQRLVLSPLNRCQPFKGFR